MPRIIDQKDEEVVEIYNLFKGVYTYIECYKAFVYCGMHTERAMQWLVEGNWKKNLPPTTINLSYAKEAEEIGTIYPLWNRDKILETLINCKGNSELSCIYLSKVNLFDALSLRRQEETEVEAPVEWVVPCMQ